MRLIILACLVASALADVSHLFNRSPQSYNRPLPVAPQAYSASGRQLAILQLNNEIYPDGRYQYNYETENGISAQENGQQRAASIGEAGTGSANVAEGNYQYTSPEGVPVQVQYTADENGYHPSGNVLPTPPPIPEAIARSIEFNLANEQQQQYQQPNYQQPQYRRF